MDAVRNTWSNGRGNRKGLVEDRLAGRSGDVRDERGVEAVVRMMEVRRIREGPNATHRR